MSGIMDRLRQGGARIRSMARTGRGLAQRPTSRVVGMLLFGAVGGLVALALTPPVEGDVGPGRVQVHARSAIDGRTEIGVPPLGTISARTHNAPLLVNATVASVDLNELQGYLVADRPTRRLIGDAERDLRSLATRVGLVSLGAGLIGGAFAGVIASNLRWRRIALGTTGGLVTVAMLLGLAWRDFDASAMSEPSYQGPIARAPQVIETISRHVDNVEGIRTRIDTLGEEFAQMYALSFATPTGVATGSETTILHVSDIHSNPVAMEVVVEMARQFDVDAVLDTGDLTSFGLGVESRITDQIRNLDIPYLFVPGNHDSAANRIAIAQHPNVRLLRNNVADINGVRILGIQDPSFTATNEITTRQADRLVANQAAETADSVRATRPDVLAVHNERMARESFGEVPLILNGHSHVSDMVSEDGTIRLAVGSTGAHGLESLMVDTDAPFEAQLLHFSGDCLRYRDYVRVHGIGGDVQIDRQAFRLTPGTDHRRPTCSDDEDEI